MNPAEAAAAVIVDELIRGGVGDIVVAPGQRSAPLAMAAAAAEVDGAVRLHVRVDERSAAFLALGLTRGGGSPVAVMCTSGSAVANFAPAVVEADASDVPLIVITADRPPELQAIGANQTIAQSDMFADFVRYALAMEAPAWREGIESYWRSCVSHAVNAATDPIGPGPVHINVAMRDPLLAGETEAEALGLAELASGDLALGVPPVLAGRPAGLPWTLDARMVSVAALAIDALLDQLGRRPGPAKGVVVVGDVAAGEPYPSEATELAEALRWPLLCEPSGNARDGGTVVMHASWLLANPEFRSRHVPDIVVTVGRVGLSRPVNALIAAAGLHIAVDPRPARTPVDPMRTAALVVAAVPAPAESCVAPAEWLDGWLAADDRAETAITTALPSFGFCGLAVARTVWQNTPASGLLFAAASWPVRFLDAVSDYRQDPPWVLGNRGTSGIDGLVSTAWGAALAHQRPPSAFAEALAALDVEEGPPQVGGPAVALLGDLAFRHDSNGLLAPSSEHRPDLAYVVIDNDGGGIFGDLEGAHPAYAAHFERVFGTPMPGDLAGYAQAAEIPVQTVTSLDMLASELADSHGTRVLLCPVGSRDSEMTALRGLRTAVANVL